MLRRDQLLIGADSWLIANPHHQWNARAINIAIQQTNARAEMPQGTGEVHGSSALAHATFTAGHRNDSLETGHAILIRPGICRGPARLLAIANIHKNTLDPRQGSNRFFRLAL